MQETLKASSFSLLKFAKKRQKIPKNIITLSEGSTFEHVPAGLIITIIGIPLTFALHWLCSPILIVGILIIIAQTGIEINTTTKQMRKYTFWTFFRTGKWLDLTQLTKIELNYQDHGGRKKRLAGQTHTAAKTFDLILFKNGGRKIIFNEFVKVGLAFQTIDTLKTLLPDIPIDNYVKAKIAHKKATRIRR